MPKSDLAGLTEEEIHSFSMLICNLTNKHMGTDFTIAVRKSLALSRATAERRLALLKACEWSGCFEYWKQVDIGNGTIEQLFTAPACPSCNQTKKNGHAPDCALAAELRGGG